MDSLLDKSWSLHHISTNSTSYRNLFLSSTTHNHLSRYFDRLSQSLSSQTKRYVDDLNDENEKLGSFRDCKYSISTLPSPNTTQNANTNSNTSGRQGTSQLIQIQLIYQHTTFTFILYTPHLILVKATASHSKQFITFLSETFSIAINPLKLASSLLCDALQRYISALTSTFDSTDDLDTEKRAAVLKSTIGTLKITISFSGPVAPHLRTMDLSVPYETVDVLSSTAEGKGFMQNLAEHIHLQTGLRLPLTSTGDEMDGQESDGAAANRRAASVGSESPSGPPLRMSKVTSAAFAVSVEGKLRFAGKVIENVVNQEDLVVAANIGMLNGIVEEAKQRSTAEGD